MRPKCRFCKIILDENNSVKVFNLYDKKHNKYFCDEKCLRADITQSNYDGNQQTTEDSIYRHNHRRKNNKQ